MSHNGEKAANCFSHSSLCVCLSLVAYSLLAQLAMPLASLSTDPNPQISSEHQRLGVSTVFPVTKTGLSSLPVITAGAGQGLQDQSSLSYLRKAAMKTE